MEKTILSMVSYTETARQTDGTGFNRASVERTLRMCWSERTSKQWSAGNPAAGQCSVTALVVQDHFGGRILKTRIGDAYHFYNEIGGSVHDLTSSQFEQEVTYMDLQSTRREAAADCSPGEYEELKRLFAQRWDDE